MDCSLSKEILDKIFSNDEESQLIIEDEYFIEANKVALKLIGASSLNIFKSIHPAMLSPEYQPDGELSKLKTNAIFAKLFEFNSIQFSWQHINLSEEPFDVIVTLKVREEGNRRLIDVNWKLI